MSAGAEEVFLTDKKLYWSGVRELKGVFKRKASPITVAVPFDQITGVAWAKPRGGDLLIVGTALAGDIGLRADRYGAAPLTSLVQALSEAMDRDA
jgi:hypothetical protein